MSDFDLTVRNARIVTADSEVTGDIGVRGETIAQVGQGLAPGRIDIDAQGGFVIPGGIDSHCHIEQLSSMGVMCADNWLTATQSAAFGGTTTVMPFAAQHRGDSLRTVTRDYLASAARQAVIDYSPHLILSETDAQTLGEDLPALIREGITSFKVFMTYDRLKLDDAQLLDVFAVAAREGALTMVHAENNDVISWIARHLIAAGHVAPKFHAVAHAPAAEIEAAHRAIQLASVCDAPVLIVHVSTAGAASAIASAQMLGAPVLGETCPHYLLLTADDLDLPGTEGAKYCCSPPPRDAASQEALWDAIRRGVLKLYSSDHAPYRYDASGKLPHGDATTFKQVANGLPGLELRMPLLYSEGVRKGRIDMRQFVALTSTNHAKTYGMYPRKGAIQPGSDADLVIWDADRTRRVTYSMLHDAAGYTPYEGREVTGWPGVVINRGRVVVENGALHAGSGAGRFIPRGAPAPVLERRAPSERAQWMRSIFSLASHRKNS
ncbi:dihydropyrimidinase [Caenimonas aquaedulcis]|uniref:D-hydantoinase n=1 Tax=Caenimonas aquaedulcis TaxID=2793270 RepID=A0A931H326_9BURK|nr:dihydropyrimidinase [Caenimonas aquaedulcis]MBG9387652.1 dihydropyrimidinase [Caenimonas aquaedulcis]